MSNEVDYEFFVKQSTKEPFTKTKNKFLVKFRVYNIFRSSVATPEGDHIFCYFPETRNHVKSGQFSIQSQDLLSDELAKKHMPEYLSNSLYIPEANHQDIIKNMCSVARSITSKGSDTNMSIFLAVSAVKVKIYEYHEYLAMTRAAIEAMEAQEPKPIPATKSSIDALEKVIFENEGSMQCMICIEEFQAGTEVTRMPCSHLYHEDCIVQWLETSHICPLCRFPMPIDLI